MYRPNITRNRASYVLDILLLNLAITQNYYSTLAFQSLLFPSHSKNGVYFSADRAKAIKTKAVVNESPTDKLIRELREENARLLERLKQAQGDPKALAAIAAEQNGEPVEEKPSAEEDTSNKIDEAGIILLKHVP